MAATTVKELETVLTDVMHDLTDVQKDVGELQGDMVQLGIVGGPTIHQLMVKVMQEVGVVSKDQENEQFGYAFRGIDSVVNQVQPALIAAGVSMGSQVVSHATDTYTTSKGTVMRWAVVHMAYTFHGPAGDTQQAEGIGEAADASDKAHMKAMQQAYKYALLQVLAIPTLEPDADATSPEGEAPPAPQDYTNWAKAAVLEAAGGNQDHARQLWDHATVQAGYDDPSQPMDQATAMSVATGAHVAAQAPFVATHTEADDKEPDDGRGDGNAQD